MNRSVLISRVAGILPEKATGFIRGNLSSDLARKVSSGIVWSFIGTVGSRMLIFLTYVAIARILKKQGFGELGMIRSTVDMFSTFAGLGLGVTATKFVSEFSQKDKVRAGRIINMSYGISWVTGIFVAALIFIFAQPLAAVSLKSTELVRDLQFGGLAILFYSVNGVQNGILLGLEKFKSISRINLIGGLINIPVAIMLSLFFGVAGAVIALACNAVVICAIGFVEVRRAARGQGINVNEPGFTKELNVLFSYSLPAVISGGLVLPVNWFCNAFLVDLPNGYQELGIYNAALNIMLVVTVINGMIGQAFLPYVVKNLDNTNKKFEMANNYLPWIVGIFISMPFMYIPELGNLLFGREFAGDVLKNSIVLVMFTTVIVAHRQGIARNFTARGYMWWSLLTNVVWGIIALVSMYFLKHYGAVGRSGAYVIAYFLTTLVFIPFYTSRKLCERDFVLSFESISIWLLILFSAALMIFAHIPIALRILALVCVLGTIVFLLIRTFKRHTA
jgi:O-antigen/teichoic acid export membrane protein